MDCITKIPAQCFSGRISKCGSFIHPVKNRRCKNTARGSKSNDSNQHPDRLVLLQQQCDAEQCQQTTAKKERITDCQHPATFLFCGNISNQRLGHYYSRGTESIKKPGPSQQQTYCRNSQIQPIENRT